MVTKVSGVSGRYGVRYGRKIREKVKLVEESKKASKECPECGKKGIKRLSKGIYECSKCGAKIAGKAYTVQ